MNQMNNEEALELLRRAGFTVPQINRIMQLRRDYRASEPLDYAHLQFIRWLVRTGRLTDQIAKEEAACASPRENKSILKMIVASMSLKRFQLGLLPLADTWFYRQAH